MYKPFNELPDHSRIWIYQLDRTLSDRETALVSKVLEAHCQAWKAHGHDLVSSYDIRYGRFVILAVDDQAGLPSGCSIDSSVRVIKELEQSLEIDFFKRTDIVFEQNEDELAVFPLSDLSQAVADRKVTPDLLVFNNLVNSIGELNKSWKQPAGQTWLSRYFK